VSSDTDFGAMTVYCRHSTSNIFTRLPRYLPAPPPTRRILPHRGAVPPLARILMHMTVNSVYFRLKSRLKTFTHSVTGNPPGPPRGDFPRQFICNAAPCPFDTDFIRILR
jgi:hypothetical protein